MPSDGTASPQGEGGQLDWQEVESSSIGSVAFDRTSNKLHVKFNSGDVWTYSDVPLQKYKSLVHAGSSGAYLRKEIVPHHAGTMQQPDDGT